jgi:L-cysteine S-thiosulfotransferase
MTTLGRLLLSFSALAVFTFSAPMAASAADLVKYKVIGKSIPKSLTGKPGDAKKGVKTAVNRKTGNCLACHSIPGVKQADHGQVGPPLMGVAKRYKEGELRLRLVEPKRLNPDTIMPSYYRNVGFHRLQKKWKGKTIISAQDVEDILAFLKTLNTYK